MSVLPMPGRSAVWVLFQRSQRWLRWFLPLSRTGFSGPALNQHGATAKKGTRLDSPFFRSGAFGFRCPRGRSHQAGRLIGPVPVIAFCIFGSLVSTTAPNLGHALSIVVSGLLPVNPVRWRIKLLMSARALRQEATPLVTGGRMPVSISAIRRLCSHAFRIWPGQIDRPSSCHQMIRIKLWPLGHGPFR